MEHRSHTAPGDDAARFLRELRQLRDRAGLGHAELAARAHFPYDSIRAAELGPALPDLPVLSAYVRGCGGTTEEWEERWRSLTRSPSLPLPVSASRHAGRSAAATAGARVGSVSQAADSPDPSIIIAALNRVAEGMASSGADGAPAPQAFTPAAETSFPAAETSFHATQYPAAEPRFPSAEPETSEKPTGWDPIRVSSAWPTIGHTPTAAEPPGTTGSAGGAGPAGTGMPWGAAPWAEDRPNAAPETRAAAPAAASRPAVGARPAPAASTGAADWGGGAAQSPSRTKILVLAVILLCVLAVLLAVFA